MTDETNRIWWTNAEHQINTIAKHTETKTQNKSNFEDETCKASMISAIHVNNDIAHSYLLEG